MAFAVSSECLSRGRRYEYTSSPARRRHVLITTPVSCSQVRVHLFSEAKGWQANDTAALRAVAPHAELHLDSSPSATIDALILMSRADVLLMGASGFSNWAVG